MNRAAHSICPLTFLIVCLGTGSLPGATNEPGPASSRNKISHLTSVPAVTKGTIHLPLRVHIVRDIELVQKGVRMSNWVTRADVSNHLLPEINRIWRAAGIQWNLESIVEQPAAKTPDRKEAIAHIQNAKRNAAGKADPKRVPKILAFCDHQQGHPVINNLYFFPYMGQTSQGVAAMRGRWAVVGVWTDKPSRGSRPPGRFLLTEEEPFKIGSIARTCSHELGHNLGLKHPDKRKQTQFQLLMGGRKSGYEFTAEQITAARKTARLRAGKILSWVRSSR